MKARKPDRGSCQIFRASFTAKVFSMSALMLTSNLSYRCCIVKSNFKIIPARLPTPRRHGEILSACKERLVGPWPQADHRRRRRFHRPRLFCELTSCESNTKENNSSNDQRENKYPRSYPHRLRFFRLIDRQSVSMKIPGE